MSQTADKNISMAEEASDNQKMILSNGKNEENNVFVVGEEATKQDTSALEDEKIIIEDYIGELEERFKEKREKRSQHNVVNIEYPDEDFFVKLDTSIKKNTAFVKRIRNMTESNRELIMKDLENLNLSRYISELSTALAETKIKVNDIPMFLQICSFLHLRYPEFAAQFFDTWIKNLPRKPSDTFNASKMRIDIKIFTELILCGIFKTKDSLPALGSLLTILTAYDKEAHKNLNIVISFCRNYCVEFAGLYPRKMRLLAEKHQLKLPECDFLPLDRQKGVRNLLKDYQQSLKAHISKDSKYLNHMKNDMKKNLVTRGEVSESLQEKWKNKSSEFEKLHASAILLADLIDEDTPDVDIETLENDSILIKQENVTAVLFDVNRFKENYSTLWDDEETRTFYENFPDLKSLVPAILYKDSLKDEPNKEQSTSQLDSMGISNDGQEPQTPPLNELEEMNKNDSILDIKDDVDLIFADEASINPKDVLLLNENDDVVENGELSVNKEEGNKQQNSGNNDNNNKNGQQALTTTSVKPTKDQLDQFFSSLPNCVNRDLIDKAALQFATTYNTKNNRKKLVKALIVVPRTRLDLLPFYSRFVAQLAPIMPTVATELCVALKNQFRYNFLKKDQVNIESKVKIVRFIGELVKFNIFPKQEVNKIFKTLLSDFHHHHIEMTCNLFETCGQYLYRCPDSHHMTDLFLQQMMRLKTHMYVDTRYETMIQNSFYSVTPENKLSSRNVESKPVIHQYVEHLIYSHLTKRTVVYVWKKLRKLDWNDKEISMFTVQSLSSAWNVKFYNITALASLLTNLSQNQPKAVVMVLDNILEDIRLGMQMNLFEYNQRRISMVKYFAECFNFNLVDSTLLFSVMYSLITYGINYSDITQSPLDPPFNMMRMRLVSQILHTCGLFLLSSPAKKKLEYFLYFFQRYYWLKKAYINSLSPDQIDENVLFNIDTIFKDTMHFLKPKFRIADSFEAACKQLEAKIKDLADSVKDVLPNAKVSVNNLLNVKASADPVQSDQDSQRTSQAAQMNGLEPIKEDSEEEDQDDDTACDYHNSDSLESDDDGPGDGGQGSGLGGDYSEDEIANNEVDFDDFPRNQSDDNSDSESFEYKANAAPPPIRCQEDEDFQKDFERLLTENLASRSQEVVRSNVEISIPIERDTDKKIKRQQQLEQYSLETSSDYHNHDQPNNTSLDDGQSLRPLQSFHFRVMTKNSKSNKPVLKSIEVPSDSELVQNFLAHEQQQKQEKEQVKKLILNINERRELEDNGGNSNNNNTLQPNSRHSNDANHYHQSGGGYYGPRPSFSSSRGGGGGGGGGYGYYHRRRF